MALPYHIYVVSSKIPQNEYTERVQYGTAFVFLVIVALIAGQFRFCSVPAAHRYSGEPPAPWNPLRRLLPGQASVPRPCASATRQSGPRRTVQSPRAAAP
jgi:hypothetical protein